MWRPEGEMPGLARLANRRLADELVSGSARGIVEELAMASTAERLGDMLAACRRSFK